MGPQAFLLKSMMMDCSPGIQTRKFCVHIGRHPGLLLPDLLHQAPEHSLRPLQMSARTNRTLVRFLELALMLFARWVSIVSHTCLKVLYLHQTDARSRHKRPRAQWKSCLEGQEPAGSK